MNRLHQPAPGYFPSSVMTPPQATAYPAHPYGTATPPAAGYYPPYYAPGTPLVAPAAPAAVAGGSTLTNSRFLKGALVGAVAAYLLTNENVQQAAIKTAVKVWSLAQGGVEEMKERFRDAEAELHAAQAQDED